MKKLVLYGAIDRYNYGDNLMPILFEKYLEKYEPEFFNNIKIIYSAIENQKNLTEYYCEPCVGINEIVDTLKASDAIIVIGGEVMCATNSLLYLHMHDSLVKTKVFKFVKRWLPNKFSKFSDRVYSSKWEYPYLPEKASLPDGVKVIYNTVGGGYGGVKNSEDKKDVINRIQGADYFSVRDERTKEKFEDLRDVVLSPDSAYLMSDVITDEFLDSIVSNNIKIICEQQYFVFQAAPDKLGCTISEISEELLKISTETNSKVILLPIGYASCHDDVQILKKIHQNIKSDSVLLTDLNIWEIMYVIKKSNMLFGSSLHGIITAMSFGVPHFGINKRVVKLDHFLKHWSVAPFNMCYPAEKISSLPSKITNENISDFCDKSSDIMKLVKENNKRIVNVIK